MFVNINESRVFFEFVNKFKSIFVFFFFIFEEFLFELVGVMSFFWIEIYDVV